MKKKNILKKVLLVAGLVGGSVALASCNNLPQQTTTTPTPTTTVTTPTTSSTTPEPTTTSTTPVVEKFTVTFDSKGGSAVQAAEVNAGSAVAKPTDPTKDGEKFVGWFTSTDNGTTLSSTAYDFTQAVNANLTLYALWGNFETVTLTIHDNPNDATATREVTVTLNRKSGNVWYGIPELADPTDDYKEFAGWYADSSLQTLAEITEGIEEDTEIWAKWAPKYETVTTGFNKDGGNGFVSWNGLASAAGFTVGTNTTEEKSYGLFKFEAGLRVNDAEKMNTQGKKITVTLTGLENEIHVAEGQWASSTDGKIYVDKVVDGTAEHIYTSTKTYKNKDVTDAIDLTQLEAGTYQIYGEKSVYISSISVAQKLEKAPVTDFEFTAEESEFLANTLADKAALKAALGIKANKIYGNGRVESITADDAQLTINVDAVDLTAEGEYTVKVGYANFTEKTFTVKVFAVESITNNMFALNDKRATQHVQTVFVTGDTFNSKNLSVVAHAKCGETTKDFTIASGFTAEKDNSNLVTVTYQGKTATYQTYTVGKLVAAEDVLLGNAVYVSVDPEATIATTGNTATVKTITQAMQLLEASKLDADVIKAISLAEGTYNEKVEVTLPNVHIQGATIVAENGEYDVEGLLAKASKYVIVYDRLAGQLDPSGQYLYSTDGSATFSVRESAVGFMAEGITFKNYYNNNDLYNESKTLEKAVMKDTQAVALLVRADKSAFRFCNVSSYHDTLYADKGRQAYQYCYIEGRTDYIFGGGTVTAYFGNSIIHTLVGDLNAEGTAAKSGNGGYVACTKGSNSAYDYIFDGCTFEADSTVLDGSVSLGRTWDTGMKLMIMNSNISAAYSKYDFKTGHKEGDITYNDRYTEMNSNKSPKKANIFEFNNTGAGALSATEAADYASVTVKANDATDVNGKYNNPLVIFAGKNGETTYEDSWNEIVKFFKGTYTEATLTIHVGDKTVVYANPLYVDSYVSRDVLNELIADLIIEGKKIGGYYTDSEKTTAFDFKIANAAIDIYVDVTGEVKITEAKELKFDQFETANVTTDTKTNIPFMTLKSNETGKLAVGADSGLEGYTKVLKTGGTIQSASRYVELDLREYSGQVKLTIIAKSGKASEQRYVQINKNGTMFKNDLALTVQKIEDKDTADICTHTLTIDCGAVYQIGSKKDGITFYSIKVEPAESTTPAPAQTTAITGFDARETGYNGWTVTMASVGSAKVATTLGYDKDKKDSTGTVNAEIELVDCPKICGSATAGAGDTVKSTKFAATKKIDLEMICSTTATSNPLYCYVDLLAEDGTVLKSVKWSPINNGKLSNKVTLTVEHTEDFYFVQIRGCHKVSDDSASNFVVLSIDGKIY
ncbi:MAG: InlB B-repeat-containing protein [Acholeplasmatales bacterium]|nr:InlB B-repeat-containing protein [Acholeplasmatales bacterium]